MTFVLWITVNDMQAFITFPCTFSLVMLSFGICTIAVFFDQIARLATHPQLLHFWLVSECCIDAGLF